MADTQTDRRETPPADERPVAGLGALVETARHTLREAGGLRGLRTLGRLNQIGGFDCPGCAWPDPPDRSLAEFCANGAKHVAHEATTRRVRADFFAKHSLDELARRADHWLGRAAATTPAAW